MSKKKLRQIFGEILMFFGIIVAFALMFIYGDAKMTAIANKPTEEAAVKIYTAPVVKAVDDLTAAVEAEAVAHIKAAPVVEAFAELTAAIEEKEQPKAPISDAVPLSWDLQQAVIDNCNEYGLDVPLVLGVMDAESDFREKVDNGICYGLMQIHKGNQGWVRKNAGVTNIFDSAQNIRAGCWILSKGIELYGDIEHALVWYNAGEVYADSTSYSREVLREADKWAAIIAKD